MIQRDIREDTGKKAMEDRCRDWSDAATSQGTPRIASNYQKLEEAKKSSSLELSERAWPCQ